MYLLGLLLIAFLVLSVIGTNWPTKTYHYALLKKLAEVLGAEPEKHGLVFSGVYSEINTIYQDREMRIRFVEGSADSLKSSSGLEIRLRLKNQSMVIMEFYPERMNKREWGHFKRFLTGESRIDSQWFILTDDLESAGGFWKEHRIEKVLLSSPNLEQILVNKEEVIVRLRRNQPAPEVKDLIDRLIEVF
jgi:hypothetical protein